MLTLECGSIGIISDTHGDVKAWRKSTKLFENCGAVFHAGDVLYHGYDGAFVSDSLAQEINICSQELFFAMGNCDRFSDAELLLPVLQPVVTVNWNGRIIAMAHGNNPTLLRRTAAEVGAKLVFSGHTHVAKVTELGSVVYLNPGSASRPLGEDPASVAIADDKGISILTLDGRHLRDYVWH